MRLFQRVKALQKASAGGGLEAVGAGLPKGLVWTSRESVVDRAKLRPGEHVAVDLILDAEGQEFPMPDGAGQFRVERAKVRERISDRAGDLGNVMREGRRVGRMLSTRKGLLRWQTLEDAIAERGPDRRVGGTGV
jgi:hypothetical protein